MSGCFPLQAATTTGARCRGKGLASHRAPPQSQSCLLTNRACPTAHPAHVVINHTDTVAVGWNTVLKPSMAVHTCTRVSPPSQWG